jgi:hypothetical protein
MQNNRPLKINNWNTLVSFLVSFSLSAPPFFLSFIFFVFETEFHVAQASLELCSSVTETGFELLILLPIDVTTISSSGSFFSSFSSSSSPFHVILLKIYLVCAQCSAYMPEGAPDLIIYGSKPPCGCWELNSVPLEEQCSQPLSHGSSPNSYVFLKKLIIIIIILLIHFTSCSLPPPQSLPSHSPSPISLPSLSRWGPPWVSLTLALQDYAGLGTSLPLRSDKAAQLEEHIPHAGSCFWDSSCSSFFGLKLHICDICVGRPRSRPYRFFGSSVSESPKGPGYFILLFFLWSSYPLRAKLRLLKMYIILEAFILYIFKSRYIKYIFKSMMFETMLYPEKSPKENNVRLL